MFNAISWISNTFRRPTTRTQARNALLVSPDRFPPSRSRSVRLGLETLEERSVPAILTVNSLDDSGQADGFLTLREAIEIVNAGSTTGRSAAEIGQISGPLSINDTIRLTTLSGTINGSRFVVTKNVKIEGPQNNALTLQGTSIGAIFLVESTATVNISNLVLQGGGNPASSVGGGISNRGTLTLTDVTIRDCQAIQGGGIHNSGTLNLERCTLTGNSAVQGGGLFNAEGSTATLHASTIDNNAAGPLAAFNVGGGGVFNAGTLIATVSTFANNRAVGILASGGGIKNVLDGNLTLRNCTLAANESPAAGRGAGIINQMGGSAKVTLFNTILSGNRAAGGQLDDIAGGDVQEESANNLVSQTGPIAGLTNAVNANRVGVNPQTVLSPDGLRFNSGSTRTIALALNSPAIGAGSIRQKGLLPGRRLDQTGYAFPANPDIGAVSSLAPTPVGTIQVSSANDVDDGDFSSGQLSLREAVRLANLIPGDNTITFANNLLTLTITLTNGELVLDDPSFDGVTGVTRIQGPGLEVLKIDGGGVSRIFHVRSGATIDGLTLRNGSAGSGGAILNESRLSLSNVTVRDSNAQGFGGGGIHNAPGGDLTLDQVTVGNNVVQGANTFGGGLLNEGTATIRRSYFAGNNAQFGFGGGIDNVGTLTIQNTTFFNNNALEHGGAISNDGTLTVLNCTVVGNTAGEGGGIFTELPIEVPFPTTTLINSIVSGNTATVGSDVFGNPLAAGSRNNLISVADLTTVLQHRPPQQGGGLLGARNGGRTISFALVENVNNPAIDAGDDDAVNTLTTDQSGVRNRKIGAHVDIGAHEQDFTPPMLVSSVAQVPGIASGGSVVHTIRFDEAVSGVDTVDFAVEAIGVTGAGIAGVAATDEEDTYLVTVNTGSGNGTVRVNVVDDNSIVDAVATSLGGPAVGDGNFTGTAQDIDKSPPTLTAAGFDDGDANDQGGVGVPLVYTITFSEPLDLTSVTVADFNNAGTAAIEIGTIQQPTPGVLTVIVTPTTAGSLILRMPTGATITDVAGNALAVPVQDDTTVQILNYPTNLVVDSAADVDDGNFTAGNLSLREAVRIANDRPGFDAITFAPGIASITLTNELIVSDSASVDGSSRAGGVTIDGGPGTNRIFDVRVGVLFQLTRLTLTGGNGNGVNRDQNGGAVNSEGALVIDDCTFVGNSAPFGGAIHSYNQGTMVVRNSTFVGNSAGTFGGAILDNGTDDAPSSLIQCTFTDNSSGTGGAIFNFGTIVMTHCTVAGNDGGGGIVGSFTSVLTLVNSIVADNIGDDVRLTNGASLNRQGVNIIRTFTLVSGAASGPVALSVDPMLGPLANNGGPTQTMALLAGSPAINAGSNANVPTGLVTDQRGVGFARVESGTVDLGAFELFVPPSPSSSPPSILPQTTVAQGRRLTAQLLNKRQSKRSSRKIRVAVITSSDGSSALEVRLPFQDSAGFKGITVSVRTVGGIDQVVASARKGKKLLEVVLM